MRWRPRVGEALHQEGLIFIFDRKSLLVTSSHATGVEG